PLLERVSLRARFSLVTPTEDDSDRGLHRARTGRRLLLGAAHGRRPPGLDSRRPRLLVLRRALRHGSYWRRQGVVTARRRCNSLDAPARASAHRRAATRRTPRFLTQREVGATRQPGHLARMRSFIPITRGGARPDRSGAKRRGGRGRPRGAPG